MSLNTTQMLALIDRNCHSSTASYSTADKIADINLALDKVFAIIFKATGRWQFDDSNHTDYPFITTNLNASQRDYTFTSDENGNLILDVYKVMVKNQDGYYYELDSVDQQSDYTMESFWDGRNTEGTPTRYDKTANGILLDAIPSYSQTAGVKIFINREGSYFQTTDTDKKAGFAGLFHEYLALEPSVRYCKRNKMFDLSDRYERDLLKMESEIRKYYRDRTKDEVITITSQDINPY